MAPRDDGRVFLYGATPMQHHLWFVGLVVLSLAVFRLPLLILSSASFQDDRYSHVFFIPLISACLVILRRESIFQEPRFCLAWGVPLFVLGITLFWAQGFVRFSDHNDYLAYATLLLAFVWAAAFILSYGTKAFRAARFPLAYLILMVPMPTFLLDRTIGALQRGSADVTQVLFRLAGVPAVWSGLAFGLKDSHFEIARECSGIHSTLILFVTSILAGHLLLRSIGAEVCFSVFAVLVAIFKNAVRVVTIACLTVYADGSYYEGWLHRKGGVVFAALALAILAPALLALQKVERFFRGEQRTLGAQSGGAAEPRTERVG
jgi:exosortase